jgi:AcrR family transcriptional regulator
MVTDEATELAAEGAQAERSSPAPRPGRRRDPRLDESLLDATRAILDESGYGGVTIEAVAARAGTSKPAVYRRWPSKAHLVHEAAFPIGAPGSLLPDTGDLTTDVHDMVVGAVQMFSRPTVRSALPGLLAELIADPTLHAKLLARFETAVWSAFRQRIAAAAARGEVRSDVDADVLIDAIAGASFMAMTLRSTESLDDRWMTSLADLIGKGIVR